MRDLFEHDKTVKAVASHYFRDTAEKEDAVQEIYIKLLSVTWPDSAPTSWVWNVGANVCRDLHNKITRQRELDQHASVGDAIDESDPLHSLLTDEKEDELALRIGNLPEDLVVVARMYYTLDYDYRTISRILNLPQGTVASRMNTARRLLMEGRHETTT